MSNVDQVLDVLRASALPLDDDDVNRARAVATALGRLGLVVYGVSPNGSVVEERIGDLT